MSSKASSKPISFATKQKPSPASTLGKRPRAALHHDSDNDDDQDNGATKHEAVTAFDANGAVTEKSKACGKEERLVIPKMKNRDWREEIRRNRQKNGKNLLPPEVQAQRAGKGMANGKAVDVVNAEGDEPQWGLTITKKITKEEPTATQSSDITVRDVEPISDVTTELPKEKTDDEKAVDALMGIETEKKKVDLIIPAAEFEEEQGDAPLTEEDAYRRAIRAAPDVSTLEDYERVPVEEFGAALLRGMGWKEGNTQKRPKEVKRRQNLLGLGATELQGAEELGAWVQKSDTKRLNSGDSKRPVERRPKANEYREREERKKESRDERYGSHRRDRDDNRHRDSDRDRDRRR